MDFPKEPHPPKARHRWCGPNNTEIEPNKKAVQNDENVANAHCENEPDTLKTFHTIKI